MDPNVSNDDHESQTELSRRRRDLYVLRNDDSITPTSILPSGQIAGPFALKYVIDNHARRKGNIERHKMRNPLSFYSNKTNPNGNFDHPHLRTSDTTGRHFLQDLAILIDQEARHDKKKKSLKKDRNGKDASQKKCSRDRK